MAAKKTDSRRVKAWLCWCHSTDPEIWIGSQRPHPRKIPGHGVEFFSDRAKIFDSPCPEGAKQALGLRRNAHVAPGTIYEIRFKRVK